MSRAILVLVFSFLCTVTSVAQEQSTGIEWDALTQEVEELRRAGKYDRAVVVAQKALEVAEKNVGPDHPDVATTLTNLAAFYRVMNRSSDAEALEQRAAGIRAIKR